MRDFSGGYARMTVGQNIVFALGPRRVGLRPLERGSRSSELGDAGAQEITDNVSCPGTDCCKLGITSSMGLNAAINRKLLEMEITDPLSRRIHIKNSGCPNGCSQHHIADIGFYGASIKVGEHTIPAYVAHIGGVYEGGKVGYGARLKVRLPAKRVPDAVERWIRMYEAERTDDAETFKAYAERVGTIRFEDEVKGDLAMPVEFGLDTMNMFMDWDRNQPYVVAAGRRRMRGLSDQLTDTLTAAAQHESLVFLCSFQKEESVILDELLGARAARSRRHDRHRRAVPRDARRPGRPSRIATACRSRSRTRPTPSVRGPAPSTAARR